MAAIKVIIIQNLKKEKKRTTPSPQLENYKMCNNPDEFTNCGDGVVLFFSFFKFCIVVTFVAAIGIGCLDSYISYNYYYELQEFCDNFPMINETDSDLYDKINPDPDLSDLYYKCEIYSDTWRTRPKSKHNETILFNTFVFKLSLVNFRNYEIVSESLNKEINNDKPKSQNINLNLVNFLCLINIFLGYFAYIFFIYNKSNALNYSVYSIGDYSIICINLGDIYKKFEKNLEYILNKEDEISNSHQKLDFKLYEEKLGFEPDKNLPKLNLFIKYLEKKLFQNYNIKRINLCYKLNEIISLQNKDTSKTKKKDTSQNNNEQELILLSKIKKLENENSKLKMRINKSEEKEKIFYNNINNKLLKAERDIQLLSLSLLIIIVLCFL